MQVLYFNAYRFDATLIVQLNVIEAQLIRFEDKNKKTIDF